MRLYLILGNYKFNGPGEMPTVLDCWDEHIRDSNPDGFQDAWEKWKDHADIDEVRQLALDVPDHHFIELFDVPVVEVL